MNEFDLVLLTLRNNGKYIFGGALIGLVIAILITLFQTPVYQATMIVAPTDRTGVPSLSSFIPQAAADAPALQYFVERIDASQSNDFTVFETLITSPSILNKLNDNIRPQNPQSWFQSRLKIKPHGLSQFRKITLRHTDQTQAIAILNQLYNVTDQTIRMNKKRQTARRISYLNEQLANVQNPNHRDAMIALLREQEQTAMMASIDNEFAAKIIEPAYISSKPIAPNWKILTPVFMMIGGLFGLIISGFRQTK